VVKISRATGTKISWPESLKCARCAVSRSCDPRGSPHQHFSHRQGSISFLSPAGLQKLPGSAAGQNSLHVDLPSCTSAGDAPAGYRCLDVTNNVRDHVTFAGKGYQNSNPSTPRHETGDILGMLYVPVVVRCRGQQHAPWLHVASFNNTSRTSPAASNTAVAFRQRVPLQRILAATLLRILDLKRSKLAFHDARSLPPANEKRQGSTSKHEVWLLTTSSSC